MGRTGCIPQKTRGQQPKWEAWNFSFWGGEGGREGGRHKRRETEKIRGAGGGEKERKGRKRCE